MWNDKKFTKEIVKIPQENLLKFYLDFQQLIIQAKKSDYNDHEFFNIKKGV